MNQSLILILLVLIGAIGIMGIVYRYLLWDNSNQSPGKKRSLRALNEEYRSVEFESQGDDPLADTPDKQWEKRGDDEAEVRRHISLQDRLRYAHLETIPTYAVSLAQIAISLSAFLLARAYLKEVLQAASLFTGPMIVNGWINYRIKKRVDRFDADFAQFLLSVVSMLKTGLNSVQSLQSAAESLEEESLVRQEVELMLERFRVGVPEDRSIGSFGEDIMQPEIELFVQALLLSRRVGGNLSDTLERLSKQTRKRLTFKRQANSGVSMQRSSLYVIIVIIIALQGYMYTMSPAMVTGAWTHPTLSGIAQGALVLVFIGILWMKKITNIKV